jgi:hypothetical protein
VRATRAVETRRFWRVLPVPTGGGHQWKPTALLLLIRIKLNDGRLSDVDIPRISGGAGNGERCDACDTPITKKQLLIEGIAPTHAEQKPTQFHVKCFYLWDAERRALKSHLCLPSEQRPVATVVCS